MEGIIQLVLVSDLPNLYVIFDGINLSRSSDYREVVTPSVLDKRS